MLLDLLDIPTAKVNQFNKKGIFTVEDLSEFFPNKYYDFRKTFAVAELKHGDVVSVTGTIIEMKSSGKMFRAKIKDAQGKYMWIVWFNQDYVAKILKIGGFYIFCGKIQIDEKYNSIQMVSPLYFGENIKDYQKVVPVYSKIQGMSDDYLFKSINSALAIVEKADYLEPIVLNKFNLVKKSIAFTNIHQPVDFISLERAKERFVFDDLFTFGMQMMQNQKDIIPKSKFIATKLDIVTKFIKSLPFKLTEGQNSALKTMYLKMKNGDRVNELLQGDVGCGKTVVAVGLMLIMFENGYQSALMCPTNVLAEQHYRDLTDMTKELGCNIAFLSGALKAKQKKEILEKISSGEINMVIGTHAVIQKDVKFKHLGLTIVDEEHRFGVAQRDQLKEKAKDGVHNVTMSATPIPRTLALAIYGENIDVSTINTLPKGRQPIKTLLYKNELKTYESMYNQIKEGRQCYVVCPLIEDSEWEGLENVDSVEKTYKKMLDYFKKYPEVKISMISGKLKKEEINEEITRFNKNEVQIIISTTIIEVGVNVPNSTVILIKNAERFGLSQLHQLRGRVGRGIHQSYCVLLSESTDNPKLLAMCETTSGFKIAEKDLQLRGTGAFIGTKQSGSNKYVMLMLSNPELYESIKKEIKVIYNDSIRYGRYSFLNSIDISEK